jgi:hypothetical protein
MYASRFFLKYGQSKGAVCSTEKPYAFASWIDSAIAAALNVTFLGTHLQQG